MTLGLCLDRATVFADITDKWLVACAMTNGIVGAALRAQR